MIQELKTKIATSAIIRHQGKILIGQRAKDGLWELPGGRINENETPDECIIREIKEELNIHVRISKFLCRLSGTFREIPMHVYAFLVDMESGDLKINVHRRIQWVDMDGIKAYGIVEEDQVILQRFRHLLKNE